MQPTQFDPQELEQIKKLQEQYSVLGVQLVQLKIALKNATDYLESLKSQEQQVEQRILETNEQEKKLGAELEAKYGAGSLDLETGQFTPNK